LIAMDVKNDAAGFSLFVQNVRIPSVE